MDSKISIVFNRDGIRIGVFTRAKHLYKLRQLQRLKLTFSRDTIISLKELPYLMDFLANLLSLQESRIILTRCRRMTDQLVTKLGKSLTTLKIIRILDVRIARTDMVTDRPMNIL